MKLSFFFNKLMIIFINVLIIIAFAAILFFVVFGLIIEPNLPQHYYGVGDLTEFLYCAGISIIIVLLFRIRKFYVSLNFLGRKTTLLSYGGLKHFVIFKKLFSRKQELFLDSSFIEGREPGAVYLVHGICLGNIFHKSYFFGYSVAPDEKNIKVYKILFSKKIPEIIKIATVPLGSECEFLLEYKVKSLIVWSFSTMGKGGYRIEFYEEMMVHNRALFGIWVDELTSSKVEVPE